MKRITLAKSNTIPDTPVLARMVEQAHNSREDVIALPFDGLGDGRFVLAVTFSASAKNIPRWYLFAGENDGAPIVWVRDTANREEIFLILSGSSTKPVQAKPERLSADGLIPPAPFDQASYYEFYQKLIDAKSNMFPPGAFYWFLSQELFRYQRTKSSFALILFDCKTATGPVDRQAIGWVGQLLSSQMRKLDYVCNLAPYIAVLLAASELSEAQAGAARLGQLIKSKSMVRDPQAAITLYAGVAAIPETCEHPGVLISAAEIALKNGLRNNQVITAYVPNMTV